MLSNYKWLLFRFSHCMQNLLYSSVTRKFLPRGWNCRRNQQQLQQQGLFHRQKFHCFCISFESVVICSYFRVKRPQPAYNVTAPVSKKGRGGGGMNNQLVNRAFEALSRGGGRGSGRGRGRGGRGRGWGYRSWDQPQVYIFIPREKRWLLASIRE